MLNFLEKIMTHSKKQETVNQTQREKAGNTKCLWVGPDVRLSRWRLQSSNYKYLEELKKTMFK